MEDRNLIIPSSSTAPSVSVVEKKFTDIASVLYLTELSKLRIETVRQWLIFFSSVHVAAPAPRPSFIPEEVCWTEYEPGDYRSQVWNQVLSKIEDPWVLFLEDDEMVDLLALTAMKRDHVRTWPPLLIQWREGETLRQCFQMRMVANTGAILFDGKHLPDCTSYIHRNDIKVGDQAIFVHRDTPLMDNLDPEEELSVKCPSPQVYLSLGARYFDNKQYVHAAAQYRKVMKAGEVLQHDRLAAMNGLASCMAEQYKWSQALEMATKSIRLDYRQRLPYLILFRIHQLAKRWEEAHEILLRYYALMGEATAANFDKVLPVQETLEHLAEVAFRAGMRKASYEHYRKLYTIRGGKVDSDFLHRLLLFATEQEHYEQATSYFFKLFADSFPDNVEGEAEKQIFEFLALFMERGWYEFASARYQELLEHQPSNEAYMRRWLVALSKSKDISKAQQVISRLRIKKRKKTG